MQLKPDTLLQGGKYRIIRTLGQGGFGITYEAEQVLLRRSVAVKEFFMKDCCERDETTSRVTVGTGSQRALVEKFRGKFIREAQMIAGMEHSNIVRVTDVFEENGTAYYVMDYLPGGSLADKVKKNGPLSEAKAEEYIRQVAGALDYIHAQNTVHLDVKPSNILLNAKGEAILIDFGISKHYDDSGEQTSSTPVGISKGYAPLEQGRDGDVSQFGPPTDIYALGATFYYLISGVIPPEASIVNEEGLTRPQGVSDRIWHVIKTAMQPRRKDRMRDIDTFLSQLNRTQSTKTPVFEEEETLVNIQGNVISKEKSISKPESAPPSSHRVRLWALLAGIAVATVTLGYIFGWKKTGRERGQEVTSAVAFNGHEYVDLGLSVKWATCNVGASSPEEYGDYFAWGETEPKKEYNADNYVFFQEYNEYLISTAEESGNKYDSYSLEATINKYNSEEEFGLVDYKVCLDLRDDAAYKNWGDPWRMPTKEEFNELLDKCSWAWGESGGVKGFWVTSKMNNNSIFLPAAGSYQGSNPSEEGFLGFYWTSTLYENITARDFDFMKNNLDFSKSSLGMTRFIGLPIRPVTSAKEESTPIQLLERKPSFKGGDANEFSKWVNSRLVYPENAKENDVQGRVTVLFDVEADGRVTNVRILQGVFESLDNEAIRVVSSSPKWKPGRYQGRAVKVTYTFPVIFQLTE